MKIERGCWKEGWYHLCSHRARVHANMNVSAHAACSGPMGHPGCMPGMGAYACLFLWGWLPCAAASA